MSLKLQTGNSLAKNGKIKKDEDLIYAGLRFIVCIFTWHTIDF